MIIGRVLHQQIFQLKWHVLACVALIMVLPLEGAIINLHAGDGFYSSAWTGLTLLLAPLMAGLIACANVQADMDEKRYQFWYSKPVSVWGLVSIKYITGLIMALVIMACPILFTVISTTVCTGERPEWYLFMHMAIIALVSLLAYSTCFLTNVLVRKTARAWLIGMALSCFVLLILLVLPLGFKDIVSDITFFWASAAYLSVTLGTVLLAFVLAILAVKHDWHLRTSLKGLLWAGAGLIFGLMLLFSHQVANIRILDDKVIEKPVQGFHLERQAGKTILPINEGLPTRTEMAGRKGTMSDIAALKIQYGLPDRYEVERADNKIKLSYIKATVSEATLSQLEAMAPRFALKKGLHSIRYHKGGVYHKIGSELYFLAICPYYVEREVIDEYGDTKKEKLWKRAYLRCFRIVEGVRIPLSSLDLSACIVEERYPHAVMRMVKDDMLALVIGNQFIGDQCMTIQVSDSGDLKQIEQKKLKAHSVFFRGGNRFEIPMIPLDSLDITARIRLSIDTYYMGELYDDYRMNGSLVHMDKGQITFVLMSDQHISRYDVVNWDQEHIDCTFRDARPFTFFELSSVIWENSQFFIQNGKLYAHNEHTLMVFDVSSDRGIRKLGHFERISAGFVIDSISVEDNGDILMLAGTNHSSDRGHEPMWRLYLLKNPQ